MELINKTNQPQPVELIDGSVKVCQPGESITINQGTIREYEIQRIVNFFNIEKSIKRDKLKLKQPNDNVVKETQLSDEIDKEGK